MRVLTVSWSQTVESLQKCAWTTVHCGLDACEKFAGAHHFLAQPYPNLDVVLAAPTYAERCTYTIYRYELDSFCATLLIISARMLFEIRTANYC